MGVSADNLRSTYLIETMTETEILQKQLAAANAEIQTLTMRLRNAEILYERELRKNEAKEADETRSQGK